MHCHSFFPVCACTQSRQLQQALGTFISRLVRAMEGEASEHGSSMTDRKTPYG